MDAVKVLMALPERDRDIGVIPDENFLAHNLLEANHSIDLVQVAASNNDDGMKITRLEPSPMAEVEENVKGREERAEEGEIVGGNDELAMTVLMWATSSWLNNP